MVVVSLRRWPAGSLAASSCIPPDCGDLGCSRHCGLAAAPPGNRPAPGYCADLCARVLAVVVAFAVDGQATPHPARVAHHSGCGFLWHRGPFPSAGDVDGLDPDLLPYPVGDHDDASPLRGLLLRRHPSPELHWRPGVVVDQVDLAVPGLHAGVVEAPRCQEGDLAEGLSRALRRQCLTTAVCD